MRGEKGMSKLGPTEVNLRTAGGGAFLRTSITLTALALWMSQGLLRMLQRLALTRLSSP